MPHQVRGLVRLSAVIASSALLAACTPATPPASSPSPSPSNAGSATPTETEFQRQERVAYEHAETAYRSFEAEYLREITSTFEPRVTQRMRSLAGGQFLRDSKRFLDSRRRSHVRSKGRSHIESVVRVAYATNRVELTVCEDASAVTVFDRRGKRLGRGIVARSDITVRLKAGEWRVWSSAQEHEVKSCDL